MSVRDEVITALRNGTNKSDWDDDCAALFFDNGIELEFGGVAFGTYSSNNENVSTSKPVFVRDSGEKIFITFEDVFCVQTETTEEKEALDIIDTTPKQIESLVNNSESPNSSEWKNGDECVINRKTSSGETLSDIGTYYAETETHYWLHGIGCRDKKEAPGNIYSKEKYWLSKPEKSEQKAERERLEAAYDLYVTGNEYCNFPSAKSFDEFKNDGFQNDFWLTIVDKTGYRKAK